MKTFVSVLAICLIVGQIRAAPTSGASTCQGATGGTNSINGAGGSTTVCQCPTGFVNQGTTAPITDPTNIDCQCPVGFAFTAKTAAANNDQTCTRCQLGTTAPASASTGAAATSANTQCTTSCSSPFTGTSSSAGGCTCASPNYVIPTAAITGTNAGAQCIACPTATGTTSTPTAVTTGTGSPYTGATTCNCPTGSTFIAPVVSNAGAVTTAASCQCNAGYYSTTASSNGNAPCTQCPTGQTSPVGSSASTACVAAKSGEVIKASVCIAIPALLLMLQ